MDKRPISITITSGAVTKGILIAVLFYLLYLVRDLALVVLTSVVVASSVEPITNWFARYRVRRLPAVLFTYIGMAVIFAGVVYFFVPILIKEVSTFIADLPKYVDYARLWFPLGDVGTTLGVEGVRTSGSLRDVVSNLSLMFSDASEGLVRTISVVFGGALSFVLIVVLSFYLAVQKNGIENFLKIITPNKHEDYVIGLWKRSQYKIGLWMQGQILLALIVGVLVFLGLSLLDVRQALFLAVVAAIFELIPIFGPILAAVPAIFIALADGGIGGALVVGGLYVIIQQFENHLIYPQVVKNIVGVSPIIVILSLIVGGKLAGFLGFFLSVPIAAALMEFVNDVDKGKHLASEVAKN